MVNDNGSVKRYPIDFDSLAKGDIVAVETIEQILEVKHGTTAYQLGCLGLCGEIEKQMSYRGPRPTLKISKGAILILHDNEATITSERRIRNDLHRAVRNYGRLTQVVIANLTDEEKTQHDRRLMSQGRLLQALARERKAMADEKRLKDGTADRTPKLEGVE